MCTQSQCRALGRRRLVWEASVMARTTWVSLGGEKSHSVYLTQAKSQSRGEKPSNLLNTGLWFENIRKTDAFYLQKQPALPSECIAHFYWTCANNMKKSEDRVKESQIADRRSRSMELSPLRLLLLAFLWSSCSFIWVNTWQLAF